MIKITMNRLAGKITKILTIISFSLIITACVSGPDEKQPEAIESANNALSLGVGHYNNSKHELAITYFKNALRDFRSIDHQYGIASSCLNLSKTYLSIGNTNTADAYLTQAQRITQSGNIKQLDDHIRIIESSIAIENNQLTQAKEILEPLLSDKSNNAFSLAAIQNRTRIAFLEKVDEEKWTNAFEKKTKSSQQSQSHKARLARFKAALSNDAESQETQLNTALNIYRKQTNRPGIAATLQEWGDVLIERNELQNAEDKLQRALYIRQSLQDKKNSLRILDSLSKISDDEKSGLWIEKLQDKNFKQWDEFLLGFDRFPD